MLETRGRPTHRLAELFQLNILEFNETKNPQERGGDEFDFDDEKAEISTGDEFILDNQLVFLNV